MHELADFGEGGVGQSVGGGVAAGEDVEEVSGVGGELGPAEADRP